MPQFAQHQKYFNDFNMLSLLEQPIPVFHGGSLLGSGDAALNELTVTRPVKADPGLEPGWPEFRPTETKPSMDDFYSGSDGLLNHAISRTTSSAPAAMADRLQSKESFRKRKADDKTLQLSKVGDENSAKKMQGCCKEEELAPKKPDEEKSNSGNSHNTKNGIKESKMKESSGGSSKESPKATEDQKPDYIHVRARRGQATDSHSLAERVRREKISERMKYLQDLVPGCNKITGKAGMLDEIINYVQSLQRQVEFLSMKLATVNPSLDFNIEDLFAKEVFPACSSNIPAIEMANFAYLQYNSGQQMDPVCESILGMSEIEMSISPTISAPVSILEAFPNSSSLTQIQSCLSWDQSDLQSMYNMEFQQAYTGPN